MPDEVVTDEIDRSFNLSFHSGLDLCTMETIKWLILGHLLYLAGLASALLLRLEMAPVWATPLFGLPLLWAGRKHRQWARILVFTLGFTGIHYLAVWTTTSSIGAGTDSDLLRPGFYGGAVGAVGAFALCFVARQLREGLATLIFAAFGAVILAGTGCLGVYMFLNTGGMGRTFASAFMQLVWIYSPWQLLFAYFLAKTLNPVGASWRGGDFRPSEDEWPSAPSEVELSQISDLLIQLESANRRSNKALSVLKVTNERALSFNEEAYRNEVRKEFVSRTDIDWDIVSTLVSKEKR